MFKYIKQAWLVLLLALIFGLALSGVNAALKPRIHANELETQRSAAIALAPGGERVEARSVEIDGAAVRVYAVFGGDDRLVGWAVPAEGNGYADVIKLMVGLTAEADELTGVAVLANNETPGLGNLIKGQSFLRQFAGKPSYVQLEAVQGVDDPAKLARDEIAALSGATISSQSVADIIFNELTANGLVYELHGLCLEARGQSPATQPSTQGGDDAQ